MNSTVSTPFERERFHHIGRAGEVVAIIAEEKVLHCSGRLAVAELFDRPCQFGWSWR